MTTKEDIIRELQLLPEQLKNAERNMHKSFQYLREEKHRLFELECDLVNEDRVKGKNDLARQAELFRHTRDQHSAILKSEISVDQMKLEYDYLRRKFEAAELIAKLMITPRV